MATPLSGPGSTRRLGTEAGTLRREARKLQRAGGNPQRLLEAAAVANMRDGSISSAESNIAEAAFQRRTDAGLAVARQGMLREAATPPAGAGSVKIGVAPGTGSGTTPSTTGGTGSKPSVTGGTAPPVTGETAPPAPPMAGKSPKPSEEEMASDERRAKARQSVLRDVLARSKGSTSMTRAGALEQINKERVAAGMPPMEFSNAEFAADDQARAEKRYEEAGRAGRSRVVKSMSYEDFGLDPVERPSTATASTPTPAATPAATPASTTAPTPSTPRPPTPAPTPPRNLADAAVRDVMGLLQSGREVAGNIAEAGARRRDSIKTGAAIILDSASDTLSRAQTGTSRILANFATTPERAAVSVVPGQTGSFLQNEAEKRRVQAQQRLRGLMPSAPGTALRQAAQSLRR